MCTLACMCFMSASEVFALAEPKRVEAKDFAVNLWSETSTAVKARMPMPTPAPSPTSTASGPSLGTGASVGASSVPGTWQRLRSQQMEHMEEEREEEGERAGGGGGRRRGEEEGEGGEGRGTMSCVATSSLRRSLLKMLERVEWTGSGGLMASWLLWLPTE